MPGGHFSERVCAFRWTFFGFYYCSDINLISCSSILRRKSIKMYLTTSELVLGKQASEQKQIKQYSEVKKMFLIFFYFN